MNTYCISSTMFNICASKKCRSDTKATESVTPCPAGRFEGGILQVCTVLCPVLNLCVVTGSRSFSIPQAAPSHPCWTQMGYTRRSMDNHSCKHNAKPNGQSINANQWTLWKDETPNAARSIEIHESLCHVYLRAWRKPANRPSNVKRKWDSVLLFEHRAWKINSWIQKKNQLTFHVMHFLWKLGGSKSFEPKKKQQHLSQDMIVDPSTCKYPRR